MDARVNAAPQLRSLRIGEIFDRATTFYVQNFIVFTLIVLTIEAPLGVLRYLLLGTVTDYTALFQQIAHPSAHPSLPSLGPAFGPSLVVTLVAALAAPFINNAIACGVAELYAGVRPTYSAAFSPVLKRAFPLLMTMLLCGAIFIGLYLALIVALFLIVLVTAGLFSGVGGSKAGAVGAIVVIGLVSVVAILALVLVVISCAFALYATTVERMSPAQAISAGFTRIFNRREAGKALLMTLAYVVLEFIVLAVSLAVSAVIGAIPVVGPPLQIAFTTVTNSLLVAFIDVLVVVYYFDVRTRSEGLDLEVDLERLTPTV